MSKGNDNLGPLGICHRLISFIINKLIDRGPKKVALAGGAVPPHESIEVPIDGSSRNIQIMQSRSSIGNGALSNEVIIDFRHIEEPEIPTSVQKFDSPKKNGFISMADQTLLHEGKERKQQYSDARDFGKGHREENLSASKRKDIPPETTSGNESEEAKGKHPARASRPLHNINEKADAFIRTRKEAMSKNYGFEQPRKL